MRKKRSRMNLKQQQPNFVISVWWSEREKRIKEKKSKRKKWMIRGAHRKSARYVTTECFDGFIFRNNIKTLTCNPTTAFTTTSIWFDFFSFSFSYLFLLIYNVVDALKVQQKVDAHLKKLLTQRTTLTSHSLVSLCTGTNCRTALMERVSLREEKNEGANEYQFVKAKTHTHTQRNTCHHSLLIIIIWIRKICRVLNREYSSN